MYPASLTKRGSTVPEFAYKATDSTGKIVEGLMEAPEKAGCHQQTAVLGYIPIKIEPTPAGREVFRSTLTCSPSLRGFPRGHHDLYQQLIHPAFPRVAPWIKAFQSWLNLTDKGELKKVVTDVLKRYPGRHVICRCPGQASQGLFF